ncbi:polysaccharide biosynthesis protein [Devosia sp.]|uniref:polysaccharide biosynthesis protein n=1 Tax=Devosia sp. TaxID=1871048 RepID=UPI002FCB2149
MISVIRNYSGALGRRQKQFVLIALDIAVLFFAVWSSYIFRLGYGFLPNANQIGLMALAPIIAVPIFVKFGLYRAVIRYLPERALWTIAWAVSVATLTWVAVLFVAEVWRVGAVPRSVPLLYWLFSIVLVGGSRFALKRVLGRGSSPGAEAVRVVIYGAGAAGTHLANALRSYGHQHVVGFIDDDKGLAGRDVAGIRVYPPSYLPDLIENVGIKEVILSVPSIDPVRRRAILSDLARYSIRIRALPAISDLVSGKYLINQVREIDIDDLLGRSSVPSDMTLIAKLLSGRTILVSGAGGSIGSELTRLVAKWSPAKIVLLEASEFALYQIERTLIVGSDIPIVPVLGSVTNEGLLRRVFAEHSIDVVFHAAAHKHVPLVEANVIEGVRNNVLGTTTIAHAALENGVSHFVLISTDKAVRPTNVMGASKRWAELIVRNCGAQSRLAGREQRFCAVRFGNVLGSNGSVVPLFKEQILAGGPVTLTDENMTRYFMSIHEAAELIVQAGALSLGEDIFLLEMGEPVRIRELAENMIRLSGMSVRDEANPDGDIEIAVVGKRPGEKMFEELFYDEAHAERTTQPKILRASSRELPGRQVEAALVTLSMALEAQDEARVREVLFDFINESRPASVDA